MASEVLPLSNVAAFRAFVFAWQGVGGEHCAAGTPS